jgi:hypothetical protein
MQVLTLKEIKAAARKAYKAKRLTAQHPDRAQRICVYSNGAYRCAIGAALTKETLAALSTFTQHSGLSVLQSQGLVTVTPRKDYYEATVIQYAHDAWARAAKASRSLKFVKSCRDKFTKLIGL